MPTYLVDLTTSLLVTQFIYKTIINILHNILKTVPIMEDGITNLTPFTQYRNQNIQKLHLLWIEISNKKFASCC